MNTLNALMMSLDTVQNRELNMQNILVLLFSFLFVHQVVYGDVEDEWDARSYTGPVFNYLDKKCVEVWIRPSSRAPAKNGWIPYGTEYVNSGKNQDHFGDCKVTLGNHLMIIFECRKDADSDLPLLPLAGAKYERIKEKGGLPSFKCTHGCTSDVPLMIHYIGNTESGDNAVNLEDNKSLKACGRK